MRCQQRTDYQRGNNQRKHGTLMPTDYTGTHAAIQTHTANADCGAFCNKNVQGSSVQNHCLQSCWVGQVRFSTGMCMRLPIRTG